MFSASIPTKNRDEYHPAYSAMPTLSGILLDADNEVVHIAVVDAPSHELLDAMHFATTRRIDIVCWTRQQMEGHAIHRRNAPA
jgi:type II secretory ATPase GspE/PulE/Tfp pilus assembly ATPase PilB-like protein